MANYTGIGDMTAKEWDRLKDQKISIGLVVLLGLSLWKVYGWADTTFISRAEAAEDVQSIQQSVDKLTDVMQTYISKSDINDAYRAKERAENNLQHLNMHEEQHGATPATKSMRRTYEKQKRDADEYYNCLMQRLPNCSHLANRG